MDYQGNSNKDKKKNPIPAKPDKTTEKKVERVTQGTVSTRKKSLGRKFKDLFVSADFKSVARYVGAEVIFPAVRNLIVDASTKGIERMMYGETSSARRGVSYGSGTRVTYNTPINRHPVDPRQRGIAGPRRRSGEEYILETRDEAERVLEVLSDIIDTYDVASLGDLHDLIGLPTSHVDNKWGWTYLTGATIRQIREGYLLDLPPAEAI